MSVYMRACQKPRTFKGRIKDKKFPMHFEEYFKYCQYFQVLFTFI